MKKVLFSTLLLLAVSAGRAQTVEQVTAWEGEIAVGPTFGARDIGADNTGGWSVLLELRRNLNQQPIDIGLQLRYSSVPREWGGSPFRLDDIFRSYEVAAVSDYNFRRGKNFSLFAGGGIGVAFCEGIAPLLYIGDDVYPTDGQFNPRFFIMPRVGIECWRHLRFTLYYQAGEQANSHFGVTIGGVFGGGRRHKK